MKQEILIVDDDEGVSTLLSCKLERDGMDVVIVRNGREALTWLKENNPDLILFDLGLPDITGRELLDSLGERGKKFPFIVVSGKNDVRLTVEMMRMGALDFVLKDASPQELVAPIVRRALESLEVRRRFEESQMRLRCISESISDVFWMMSANGERMLYVSPSYEKIWGHPVDYLYSNPTSWYESIIEEDRSKVLRSFEKLREGLERDFDEVYGIRDKVNGLRWIRDRGYASYGTNGEVLHLTGVATEITEHKALERQVVEVAEKERIRIGQDLHDDLCQRLAALKLKCGMVHDSFLQKSGEGVEQMQAIIDEIQEATALTRAIAKGLSPVSLEAEGLMEGLKHFAEMVEGRFGISCRFDCPEAVEVGNTTTATHIFRIAQELVQNAAKHAAPRRILIGLYNAMGGLRLEVINDGKPFYGPKRRREGMGLHFIQFRADAIGASIDFFPGAPPDGGTRIVCSVPLGMESERLLKQGR